MATADTIKISDGTTDIELVLDTDGFEMIAGGGGFGISNHDNLYHKSDWQDGEMLVREKTENKTWSFKLAVRGATDNAIINTIRDFNKMIRQARQYHISRDVAKVYLYIKLDGATNATYYDIIDVQPKGLGLFDYINRNMGEVVFNGGLSIDVITEPFGYGDIQVLENELWNPHFEEDTDLDDFPDGWTDGGTLTTSELSAAQSSVGSVSMYCVGSGIILSDIIASAAASRDVVGSAYFYIAGSTSSAKVRLWNQTDSAYIGTGDADTQIEDEWQKVTVSGTLPANKTILMRIEIGTGDTYVDQTYLQFSDTQPTGWMSYKQLINHHDDDEGDINYIDIADIDGDVDAETRITLITNTGSSVSRPTVWVGKRTKDNVYHRLTLDSTEEDSTPTGTSTNADYSFGEYSGYTLSTLDDWADFMHWDFPDGTDALDFNGKFMLILVGDSFDNDVYFKARFLYQGLTTIVETEPVLGSGIDTLEIGVLDLPPGFNDTSGDVYAFTLSIMAYNNTGQSRSWEVDYLLLMPLSNYRIMKQKGYLLSDGTGFADDGIVTKRLYKRGTLGDSYRDASIYYGLGEQITLDPTKKERLVFLWQVGDVYDPQQTFYARIEYLPRTEFLIGT